MLDTENNPALASKNREKHMDVPMAAPPVSEQGVDMVVDRATASYVNEDKPFRIAQRNYERQYAQLYFARLQLMIEPLRAAVAKRWPGIELVKILDVGDRAEGSPCCVIGTVYKEMKLKPSILDEYTKDRGLRAALASTSLCSDDDHVALEDEGGRMTLKGVHEALPVQQLVTGVVVAVRGENQPGGDFIAQEVLYPDMAPQEPAPVLQEDKYCAFISGLRLSTSQADMMQLHLAQDLLSGYGGAEEEMDRAARTVRLVVAGGCLGNLDSLASSAPVGYGKTQQLAIQPIKDLDMYLAELAGALPVDVMPGPEDPANVALPQQPLHRCLLPLAAASGAVFPSTNPHAFTLDGVHFLGSSGQPVEDMAKYSVHPDRLSVLEHCLRWRHLAPTAPDTLATYPFHDDDPFIIRRTPHVLFAANQPEFASRTVTGPQGQVVRVVCVPSFSQTGVVVYVNLRTLEATPVRLASGSEALRAPPPTAQELPETQ